MKSFLIKLSPILVIILVSMAMVTKANTAEKVVGQLSEANLILYATEKEGDLDRNLTNFKLKLKGQTYFLPRWMNVVNPTYYPELYYSDMNNDLKKEIIIVLTTGTGSGIVIQEVHVFHENNGDLVEILVDNPMAIINKNVKTKSSKTEAIITIGNNTTKINVEELGIVPAHISENVGFGNKLKFKVIEHKLVAIVDASIAPTGGGLGEIHIAYTFKDNMYQAEQIKFIPFWKLEFY
jgi:hypothetical protein